MSWQDDAQWLDDQYREKREERSKEIQDNLMPPKKNAYLGWHIKQEALHEKFEKRRA